MPTSYVVNSGFINSKRDINHWWSWSFVLDTRFHDEALEVTLTNAQWMTPGLLCKHLHAPAACRAQSQHPSSAANVCTRSLRGTAPSSCNDFQQFWPTFHFTLRMGRMKSLDRRGPWRYHVLYINLTKLFVKCFMLLATPALRLYKQHRTNLQKLLKQHLQTHGTKIIKTKLA